MSSPTQRRLTPSDIGDLARASFGPNTRLAECAELSGGGFAAVWRVRLADGRTTVLKVAPESGIRLLRYEQDLITAEASYFNLVRRHTDDVPVPEVLFLADGGEWLFTSHLNGTALPELQGGNHTQVRHDLGRAMAQVHAITGAEFGYATGARPRGSQWWEVFATMVEDLLADAVTWKVELPVDPQLIRELIKANAAVLDEVQRPALVHFDLWDGNVLAAADAGGELRLTGLVDGERYLYGDPLIDFVSPAILRQIEDEPEHPFLHGYAEAIGEPITFDTAAKLRLGLYRMHLYLLMTVEMPSRGMNADQHGYRGQALAAQVQALIR